MTPTHMTTPSHTGRMLDITLSTLIACVLLAAPTVHAYYTVQDTGELLSEKEKQVGGELQFATTGNSGINLIGHFDMGFDKESNLRFEAGTGVTTAVVGAFFKWVPFPDFENQPAIGFSFGAHYARYEQANEIAARFIPLASKKFDTTKGLFTPYVALPVSMSNYDNTSFHPVQFVIGSRYKHPDFDTFDFNAELGFSVTDADAHISIGAIFPAFE